MAQRGDKYAAAAERVPEALREAFGQLVEEYAFLARTHYGHGFVNYEVLADLILAGWRPSAARHSSSKL